MKDYEFLRWVVNGGPTPRIPLAQQETRLLAIADQIEKLSNTPEIPSIPPELIKRLCQLSCGHKRYVTDAHIGRSARCDFCPSHEPMSRVAIIY